MFRNGAAIMPKSSGQEVAADTAAAVICGKGDEDLLDHCDVHVVDPERVTAVRGRLITPGVAGQMAAVFKVLADQSRCRLVAAIIEAGELCVCDLAATVDMTESNVSHHLRVLRANGLVRARRAGKMVFYSPDDAHIRLLLDITREHVEHGPEDLAGELAVAGAAAAVDGGLAASAGAGDGRP
jgi:DNA-binding transcriptional ArsR family regulator